MIDLDAAIRAKLAAPDNGDAGQDDWGDHWDDYNDARAAIIAVLKLHAPIDKGKRAYCECQIDDGVIWEHYPCDTVKTVAAALGIEVVDA